VKKKMKVCITCSLEQNTGVGIIESDVERHIKVLNHQVVNAKGWDNSTKTPLE